MLCRYRDVRRDIPEGWSDDIVQFGLAVEMKSSLKTGVDVRYHPDWVGRFTPFCLGALQIHSTKSGDYFFN